MSFPKNNETAAAVALNYNFLNWQEFTNKNKKILLNYQFHESQKIQIQGGQPSEEELAQLSSLVPLQTISNSTGVVLTFSPQDKKLILKKEKFNKDFDYSNLNQIFAEMIDSKISEVAAIGLNYSADFVLGDLKLQLLSDKVLEIDAFKRNETFEFVLPAKYDDYLATYRIRKILPIDSCNGRVYEVSVNFHFDLNNLMSKEKMNKLDEIKNKDYYQEFVDTANKFLELNDGK